MSSSAPSPDQTLPMPALQSKLEWSPSGLSRAEAEQRLTRYGPNELEQERANPLLAFLSCFWGPIPWMIEAAAILSAVDRHWLDLGIILVLLLNDGAILSIAYDDVHYQQRPWCGSWSMIE